VVRLLDGSLDPTLQVWVQVEQADGKIVLAGSFVSFNGVV
jgi:hypothetical protein